MAVIPPAATRSGYITAGWRMDYGDCDPDSLAAAIAEQLATPAGFATVETGGARRAAEMVAELL